MGKVKSILVGMGAALGVTALGLDVSTSLSTLGLYVGSLGPLLVLAGIPMFLNFVFAYVLLRARDQAMTRYSMLLTGTVISLVVGFLAFQGIFTDLIPAG